MTTEAKTQQAIIHWLTDLDYTHINGNIFLQNANEVILKNQLLAFIQKQYPQLPSELQEVVFAEFLKRSDIHNS